MMATINKIGITKEWLKLRYKASDEELDFLIRNINGEIEGQIRNAIPVNLVFNKDGKMLGANTDIGAYDTHRGYIVNMDSI